MQENDACKRVQVTIAFWMTRLLSTSAVLDSITGSDYEYEHLALNARGMGKRCGSAVGGWCQLKHSRWWGDQ